jgi:hypothetical protein
MQERTATKDSLILNVSDVIVIIKRLPIELVIFTERVRGLFDPIHTIMG